MRKLLLLAVCAAVVLLTCSIASASSSRLEAGKLIKEIESTVKADGKVISSGSPEAIREHNQRYQRLAAYAEKIFKPSDACSFALASARTSWSDLQRFSQKHDPLSQKFLQNHQADYQDNMKLCKKSIGGL